MLVDSVLLKSNITSGLVGWLFFGLLVILAVTVREMLKSSNKIVFLSVFCLLSFILKHYY